MNLMLPLKYKDITLQIRKSAYKGFTALYQLQNTT
jgi:hypothetical protein